MVSQTGGHPRIEFDSVLWRWCFQVDRDIVITPWHWAWFGDLPAATWIIPVEVHHFTDDVRRVEIDPAQTVRSRRLGMLLINQSDARGAVIDSLYIGECLRYRLLPNLPGRHLY